MCNCSASTGGFLSPLDPLYSPSPCRHRVVGLQLSQAVRSYLRRLNDLRTFNFRAITIDALGNFRLTAALRDHTQSTHTHTRIRTEADSAGRRPVAAVLSRFPLTLTLDFVAADDYAQCALSQLALTLFLFTVTTRLSVGGSGSYQHFL